MIQEKFVLFLCEVIMKKLRQAMKQMILLKDLLVLSGIIIKKKRNGSNFVFESVGLLSYHIHKTSLKRGNSYIKSPEWLANKKP